MGFPSIHILSQMFSLAVILRNYAYLWHIYHIYYITYRYFSDTFFILFAKVYHKFAKFKLIQVYISKTFVYYIIYLVVSFIVYYQSIVFYENVLIFGLFLLKLTIRRTSLLKNYWDDFQFLNAILSLITRPTINSKIASL